ncbi:MAG: hypothetical protein PHI55_03025 [Burkholderiaceae bacterium]|nr:hypothetical protein [Burkholderiaceae bacterium]
MTSFASTPYSTQHQGVARAENAAHSLHRLVARFEGARGAASLGLAAGVSAVVVVANQVIDTWTEGHLLAAWMVLWVLAFASLALLTLPARRLSRALSRASRHGAERRRLAAADAQMWDLALKDARVMADISRAMDRASR